MRVEFLTFDLVYGLGLSWAQELEIAETEMVVLPTVLCQNLLRPTLVHLQGCMRVGIEKEEVELIHQVIELVADWAGKKLDPLKRIADI